MGRQTTTLRFGAEDHMVFRALLLDQLGEVISRMADPLSSWQESDECIGDETEMVAVHSDSGEPYLEAWTIAEALGDPFQLEIAPWMIEHNGAVLPLAGRPFVARRAELTAVVRRLNLQLEGAEIGVYGILPTLKREHAQHMVQSARFRAMGDELDRGYGPWEAAFNIPGAERLQWSGNGISGAVFPTSHQVHVPTSVPTLARDFNAASWAAAFMIGWCGNSPLLGGRRVSNNCARLRVWSGATRDRVSDDGLGHRWAHNPWDPIVQQVVIPSILPERSGQSRALLQEITLDLGSTHRAIQIVLAPDHVRLEIRYLPAGLSVADMIAAEAAVIAVNAWFARRVNDWIKRGVPFDTARRNFQLARDFGADAVLELPGHGDITPRQFYRRYEDDLIGALTARRVEEEDAIVALAPLGLVARGAMNGDPHKRIDSSRCFARSVFLLA